MGESFHPGHGTGEPGWRLPVVLLRDDDYEFFGLGVVVNPSRRQGEISPQLAFTGLPGNPVGFNSGIRGQYRENEGRDQKRDARATNINLPLGKAQQLLGRFGHGFLRHQIIFLTLFGCLTAGLSSVLRGLLTFDGRGLIYGLGGLALFGDPFAFTLCSWSIRVYRLALLDWGRASVGTPRRLLGE